MLLYLHECKVTCKDNNNNNNNNNIITKMIIVVFIIIHHRIMTHEVCCDVYTLIHKVFL